MKTLFGSIVSLMLGLVIGWYVEHKHSGREGDEAAAQFMQATKSSDREQEARDVRAIELIESGETQKAVQLLSRPIGYYYYLYAADVDTNLDLKARAMIDRLASSNQIVAAEMTNQKASFDLPRKAE